MALDLWVPPSAARVTWVGPIDPTPLARAGDENAVLDESVRVPSSATDVWRVTCSGAAPAPAHGAIAQVRLYGRIFYSRWGTNGWDFSTFGPYVSPFVKIDGVTHFLAPDWTYINGIQTHCGIDIRNYFHNWNQGLAVASRHVVWDITSLADWDDAKLAACEYGFAMDGGATGVPNQIAGLMPYPGEPSGGTPQYNVSQSILRVGTADPPAPPIVYARGIPVVFA